MTRNRFCNLHYAPPGELELEEGLDHPLSELHGVNNLSMGSSSSAYAMGAVAAAPGSGAGGGNVWRWLHTWVAAAAAAAPTRTEALLHQFIGQVGRHAGLRGWEAGRLLRLSCFHSSKAHCVQMGYR